MRWCRLLEVPRLVVRSLSIRAALRLTMPVERFTLSSRTLCVDNHTRPFTATFGILPEWRLRLLRRKSRASASAHAAMAAHAATSSTRILIVHRGDGHIKLPLLVALLGVFSLVSSFTDSRGDRRRAATLQRPLRSRHLSRAFTTRTSITAADGGAARPPDPILRWEARTLGNVERDQPARQPRRAREPAFRSRPSLSTSTRKT